MKVFFGFLIIVPAIVAGNLLMKLGADSPDSEKIVLGLLSWKSLAGLFLFGAAVLVYAWILKWIPLYLAQSFAASQFVGVVLVSALFLSEPISLMRWIGITLIAIGIIWVGWS